MKYTLTPYAWLSDNDMKHGYVNHVLSGTSNLCYLFISLTTLK